jgi:uncharacterized membrane protein YdbT with pleckstrin-like domain
VELAAGETLLFEGHPSWRSILGFHAKGLLLAVVVGVIAYVATGTEVGWGIVAFLGVLAVAILVGTIRLMATTYKVTDQRLWIRRGILSKAVQETRLTRVQNVNTRQSLFERMLHVGTVDFDTAGSDDYDFTFYGVADPDDIAHRVNEAIRRMPVHG